MTRKETVTLTTGQEREVTVGFLSYEAKNRILSESIEMGSEGNNISVNKIDFFGLKNKVLKETVRGAPINEICEEDGEKIFQEYFGKLMESLTGGESQGN